MHIVGHIWQFVERDVEMVDGEVKCKGHIRRWVLGGSRWNPFYIHPETGILSLWEAPHRQQPAKKARYKREKEKAKWKKRRDTKTDKTPPQIIAQSPTPAWQRKAHYKIFYTAAYDADIENHWLEERIQAEQAEKANKKPKHYQELRLLFLGDSLNRKSTPSVFDIQQILGKPKSMRNTVLAA
jgi:hypothetical protein